MSGKQGDAQSKVSAIEDEAIEWLVRMRGPDAASLKGRFEQWHSLSAEHRRAYEWAARHFAASEVLKHSLRHGRHTRRAMPAIPWLIGGTAIAASVLLFVFGRPLQFSEGGPSTATPSLTSQLITKRGEIRTFRLSDGSSVTLDTDSKLAFTLDASARHLDLAQGKARIVIAPDARPFVVTAGAGAVTAGAATFDLAYDDDRQVLVRLISGSAQVRPAIRPAAYTIPVRQVFAGHSFAYRASDFQVAAVPARLREVNDAHWPSGWVEYRSVPLELLVAQANRYADRPIILDGISIRSLEASGRFRLTDTDAFANRIGEVFDLNVSRREDGIHLSPR